MMHLPPASARPEKTNFFGLDLKGLRDDLARYDAPPFHAVQIYRWLYQKRRLDVESWTDLPLELRRRLGEDVRVDAGKLAQRVEAPDGTIKYRTEFSSGASVESVFMMHGERITLCISSQVGCALGCDFCLTARMGLVRNLAAGEIVAQVLLILEDRAIDRTGFNLVFMGMGEPLHNYEAVATALGLLTDPDGFGISRRRITVSTVGLAPAIERLAASSLRPRLAVSLNATTDELRDRLMPINRKYPIARLLAACREFSDRGGQRLTFEYVLLDGINDSADDVRRLARLVEKIPARVNLIPFNAVPGILPYRTPSPERVEAFRSGLHDRRVPVSVRWSRGADARAACGQLALLDRES